MNRTVRRVAAVAALGAAVGIAAPVASASAASAPAGLATVIGPTVITTGTGVSYLNSNNQITAGSAVVGPQIALP